ncbi:MAG: phosphoenolpyruvate carboxykinase (GTP) [Planctomycetota bacterium]
MPQNVEQFLKENLDETDLRKLTDLPNPKLHRFVAEAIELGKPKQVFVVTDDPGDIARVRQLAIDLGEERPLEMEGHTVHFDGPHDQARDKENTKYLVPPGDDLGENLNQTDKEAGLAEVKGFLDGAMAGKVLFVRFFCLGPTESPFSISGVQCTDSAYVAHSEDLLYRSGYEQFRRLGDRPEFFRVLHSAGELDERNTSKHVDKRRVYIDYEDECVYSVNTQYAGNTVGFKKLSLRLAIRRADREGWLAEHMLVAGFHGPNDRVTYFTGAFPSACGKTSTAMLPGETIVGDDLAYLRIIDGQARAVNVESGIFGIIRDVNPDDDPVIYECLIRPGEVIFSNVLIVDGVPYWLGMGRDLPERGENYVGDWHQGMTDEDGNELTASHRNARYTLAMAPLSNLDPNWDDPQGVPVGGVIYGGRDSDTAVPVKMAFDWTHGLCLMGAALESETTAATLGKQGVRKFQPMSNLDFVSIPIGRYLGNNLDFGNRLDEPPKVFATNYFLKNENGDYLNGMTDKRVWAKWMELAVHGDVETLSAPTGLLPRYEDLRRLFREVLHRDYPESDYVEQFTVRIPETLAKLDRIETIYREQISDAPDVFFRALEDQRTRLLGAQSQHGDRLSPLDLS